MLEWVINGKHHGELFGVKGTEQPIGHYGLSIVHYEQRGQGRDASIATASSAR